jgi:transcriptional/translational regulatory protein YebC/TACO1
MDVAIEAGATDVLVDEGQIEIITASDNYHAILGALQAENFEVEHSHITMRPQTLVAIDKEMAESLDKLIDALEDLDDVQIVHSNADYPEHFFESEE